MTLNTAAQIIAATILEPGEEVVRISETESGDYDVTYRCIYLGEEGKMVVDRATVEGTARDAAEQ